MVNNSISTGKMYVRKLLYIALVLVLAISTTKSDFNPSEEQYQRYYKWKQKWQNIFFFWLHDETFVKLPDSTS